MSDTHDHGAHAAAPLLEPKSPLWLPALGAALFLLAGMWWAMSPKDAPAEIKAEKPAEKPAAAAAAAPKPAASGAAAKFIQAHAPSGAPH